MKKMTNPNTGLAAAASETSAVRCSGREFSRVEIAAASAARHRAAIMSMDNPFVFANAKASLAGETPGQLQRDGAGAAAAKRRRAGQPIPNHAGQWQRSRDSARRPDIGSPSATKSQAAIRVAVKSKVVAIEPATQAAASGGGSSVRRREAHRPG